MADKLNREASLRCGAVTDGKGDFLGTWTSEAGDCGGWAWFSGLEDLFRQYPDAHWRTVTVGDYDASQIN